MAKRMAMHTQAEGRVLLGTVMIKRLQTLVLWVRDQQKRGLTLNAADFDAGTMNQASEMKTLRRKQAKKEPSVNDLGKFDPDDFKRLSQSPHSILRSFTQTVALHCAP
jgi:hypothetical protein